MNPGAMQNAICIGMETPRANPQNKKSLQSDDDLVRVGNVEVGAEQFADKIRIGVAGIKERHSITESIPLRLKGSDLRFTLIQSRKVFPPGQHAAWSGESQPSHHHEGSECSPPS